MHRLTLTLALAVGLAGLGLPRASGAEDLWTRRDAQGLVTVTLTLAALPGPGAQLKVKVVLDTHAVSLDQIALDKAVAVRLPDGTELPPTAVEEAAGGGHHRSAVLVFPPAAVSGSPPGRGHLPADLHSAEDPGRRDGSQPRRSAGARPGRGAWSAGGDRRREAGGPVDAPAA